MTLVRSHISPDNLQKVCRVCLEEKPDNIDFGSIMEFQDIDVASIAIVDILQKLAPAGVI